ncbi:MULTISPECIES: conjugal transfer protein TraN [Herbaspirillum]|uniref:Conjugal transfer protein TraN n=2 Tax=Herbaspirillum huttiense TaxID=863372 RepID=A0AAJ2LVT0_9BURK|nr:MULTISPECIES: conjugal transfer protein TraN [Herbaspirillum]MDR9836838.1 conjugal transfer protein TraN [Herbaspirillum huttiense]
MVRIFLRRVVMALGLFLFLNVANASVCHFDSQVCVDATPCKSYGGYMACLADVGRSCWTYQRNYTCIKQVQVDYCTALSKMGGCWQSSTACVQTDWDGACMRQNFTYRCSAEDTPTPANTVRLDDSYTITRDELDVSQCQTYTQNPLCYLAEHKCVEPGGTRVINGLPVTKECWKYEDKYSCINPTPQNDCKALDAKGCTRIDSTCIESTDPIGCVMSQVTYSCVVKEGVTTQVQDCSASVSCKDGVCWDTSHPNDGDFAAVVAGMEAARQAGVYGADSMNLFTGTAEKCAKGYGGLKNCCKSDPSGQTNNAVMMQAVGGAVKMGSKYVFDYMYQSSEYIQAGMAAMGFDGIEMASKFGSSFEMYGLSYSFGAGALAAGETATGAFGQTIYGLGNGFAFDPYSFAAAVAIQVIMELMSCEPEEQQLGMHKGANLCHFVGSYCSSKFLGVCLETTESYCCYNSKLGKIINEQGKPQIGKGWGTAESPQCAGFTPEEFQRVDFSKIDMSEFVGDIMNATDLPNVGDLQKTISQKMTGITANPGTNAGGTTK